MVMSGLPPRRSVLLGVAYLYRRLLVQVRTWYTGGQSVVSLSCNRVGTCRLLLLERSGIAGSLLYLRYTTVPPPDESAPIPYPSGMFNVQCGRGLLNGTLSVIKVC
jgi:hypothetical protein